MSICLCNLSADKALELAAKEERELTPASLDLDMLSADPTKAMEALGDFADKLPRPIELMVGSAKARRLSSDVACHVWQGALPGSSLLMLSEGVFVTSPELTLLQQASQLHQANLCQMLGRYLGTWMPAPEKQSGQKERASLTTFDSLHRFLLDMGQSKGKGNLKLAMAYTCEAAASAPETTLQLVMCLPSELHGFGLPLPIMNYEVDLSATARMLYPAEAIRIDLCWPDAWFGLEYQGDEHGKQLGKDYARWYAARSEGYELWYVAKEQLQSADQMDYIAREVAQRIGHKIDERHWPTQSELQDLLDTLAGHQHPKPISRKELRKRRAAWTRKARRS